MKLFVEGDLSQAFDKQKASLKREVESQDKNYLLNANETELIAHLVQKYSIEPVTLKEDEVYADDAERQIPAERFGFDFNVTPGQSYPKQVIRFHLPFEGDVNLLRLKPSTWLMWSEDVQVSGREIVWEKVNFRDNVEEIKREWDRFLDNTKTQIKHQQKDIEIYNRQLETDVPRLIRSRKEEHLKKANTLASLGVPIRKAASVPATYAVPALKKKVIIPKPAASSAPFAPEPTLPETVYQDILKVTHDFGVQIERHPSVYAGKDEEGLRDILLALLSPHFESVTGETFNKGGKTDILIRHEGKNVFVAECAMWKGPKHFLGKIDQLLGYLTWRDSKVAVVSFVPNKYITSVLSTVMSEIKTHDCFVREGKHSDEGWLNYEFCLKGDRSRPVYLAVQLFHFPA